MQIPHNVPQLARLRGGRSPRKSLALADVPGFDDVLAGGQIAGSRAHQEDAFQVTACGGRDPDGCDLLMVLADGMGGHRNGAEASRLAVLTFVDTFRQTTGGIAARLRASLDAANAAVGQRTEKHFNAGMGCTLVACVITRGETAHWVSVGDSPLWRVRADTNGLVRLNADHSMRPVLDQLVRLGHMTAAEARGGTAHNLRSAVTGKELTLIDESAAPIRLEVGDRIVMASDGLETLSEAEIGHLCSERRSCAAIVSDLLQAVETQAKSFQDNATVVVYRHVAAGAGRRRRVSRR